MEARTSRTGIVAAAPERPPLPKQHAVGDRVVWAEPDFVGDGITRGKQYEVVGSNSVFAEIIEDGGKKHGWYHRRFAPAVADAPSVRMVA